MFFHIYMFKNLSAKHYQENEERLQRKLFRYENLSKEEKNNIYIYIYTYTFHFLLMFAQQIKNVILRLCKFNFGKLFSREQFFRKVFWNVISREQFKKKKKFKCAVFKGATF